MSLTVEIITPAQFPTYLPALVTLLQDTVDHGASIGFLPPLAADMAESYWREVFASVEKGTVILWLAHYNEQVVGTVQLALATKPNAPHRAEVQKLMVHRQARRQGVARALMQQMEIYARQHGRTLLVLDTRQGDHAEQLYNQMGYVVAGVIPQYVVNSEGILEATVLFYKILA